MATPWPCPHISVCAPILNILPLTSPQASARWRVSPMCSALLPHRLTCMVGCADRRATAVGQGSGEVHLAIAGNRWSRSWQWFRSTMTLWWTAWRGDWPRGGAGGDWPGSLAWQDWGSRPWRSPLAAVPRERRKRRSARRGPQSAASSASRWIAPATAARAASNAAWGRPARMAPARASVAATARPVARRAAPADSSARVVCSVQRVGHRPSLAAPDRRVTPGCHASWAFCAALALRCSSRSSRSKEASSLAFTSLCPGRRRERVVPIGFSQCSQPKNPSPGHRERGWGESSFCALPKTSRR